MNNSFTAIDCRAGCGACCIAPSISSPIPGMVGGKPAGVRCIHLSDDYLCGLWGRPERPAVCNSLRAHVEMCGSNRWQALLRLARLEKATRPDSAAQSVI
ncbi:MAG: YkgJ family cysteine cluster protein [Verrucomicrobiota bacterium]|nr:YkgJ family cysteine cluster protein [Verrucomicrobiota bacterium]